nr:MAG TPA: hypothetical protein [Caudoviricetes sp.]DAS62649.1 MAG TPA: hypothetical protein [Bacteriophage sp.]DAT12904.1 MAG TPA: hypothetical protein [Bacteriophage sp.]DAU31046.1 MAG TPA: hypothetical protein [Bacteriophage sp.]
MFNQSINLDLYYLYLRHQSNVSLIRYEQR